MPGLDARTRRLLFRIVLVALAVRLVAMVFLYSDLLVPIEDHFPFGWETGRVARSIAEGRGFGSPFNGDSGPTAALPPVYPYLLAGIFKLYGTYSKASALAILSVQGMFSALTCLPIFYIARRAFDDRRARWAAWTWCFFPYAVYIPSHEVWETSLTPLLLSTLVLLALQLEQPPRASKWVVFGSLWGFMALTSPAMLSMLPFVLGWLGYRLARRQMRWIGGAATAVLVLLLCVAPWFIRNYAAFGRFIPFRDNFGLELYVGNSLETGEPWRAWMHPAHSPGEMQQMLRLGEISYMSEKRRQAHAFIAAHPGVFAWLTLKRIVFIWTGIWNLSPNYLQVNLPDTLNILFCSATTLLAFIGLRGTFRVNPPVAWLFVGLMLLEPLAYYVTHVEVPYRHPLDPLLVVLIACALTESSARRQPSARPSTVIEPKFSG